MTTITVTTILSFRSRIVSIPSASKTASTSWNNSTDRFDFQLATELTIFRYFP